VVTSGWSHHYPSPASNASIVAAKFIICKEFLLKTVALCCVRLQTCYAAGPPHSRAVSVGA
jgi:hypothetical protein